MRMEPNRHIGWFWVMITLAGLFFVITNAPAQEAPQQPQTLSAEDEAFAVAEALEEDEEPIPQIADPLYYLNKGFFHFNDKLYFWGLKPIAEIYRSVLPRPFRTGIRNFYANLKMPIRFVNCLLQGKTDRAGVELGRFMVNTVFGGLGFWNAANLEPNLSEPPDEDLGQTFGSYGIPHGFYLVWPILGPSTLRDTFGRVGDMFIDPVTVMAPDASSYLNAHEQVNRLSLNIGDYDSIKKAAVDPYESFKGIYLQYRAKELKQ